MSSAIIKILRFVQLFWIVLTLALTGNMVSIQSGPSIINYDVFTCVFCLLSLLYLIPASFSDGLAFHWALPVGLDVFNVLFTFCGAVGTAGYLGVHSCNDQDYLNYNIVTAGSEQRCREGQASTAFLWFAWAAFMATLVLTALAGRGSGRITGPRRGPVMSQV